MASRDRLREGLKKLHDTEVVVNSMKADLARLQPELEAKAAATVELLTKVRAISKRFGKLFGLQCATHRCNKGICHLPCSDTRLPDM